LTETPTTIRERRTEPRFALKLRIHLLGVDERNAVFGEHTYSHFISRHGLCFTTPKRITPGSPLSVRVVDTPILSPSFVFKIRWRNEYLGSCLYGASLDGSDEWSDVLEKMGISLEGETT
jgi:hypothetical protein